MSFFRFDFDREADIQHLHIIANATNTLVAYYRIQAQRRIHSAHFFSLKRFVVLMDDGSLYTGWVDQPVLTQLSDAQGPANIGYYLEEESSCLWLATTSKDDRTYILQCWDLAEGELFKQIELPKYTSLSTLTRRSDGCFIFYEHNFEDLADTEAEHGFYCLNPQTKEGSYHKLASKPVAQDGYLNRNALFVNNKDIAVLPAADEYLSRENEAGEKLYTYQVQLIDLNDFSIRWSKPVKEFQAKFLCNYADDAQEKEEELDALVQEPNEEDNTEAAEEWSEFLDSIMLCSDEDAFWLRWQDNSVLKVGFDGTLLTPTYFLEHKKEELAFSDRTPRVNAEFLIMYENTLVNIPPYYYIDLFKDAYEHEGKPTLAVQTLKRKRLNIDPSFYKMVQNYGVNLITVEDFHQEGYTEAVRLLAKQLQNIEDLVHDNTLVFEFIDCYGRHKTEDDVISRAIYIENNLVFIQEAISAFSAYKNAKALVNAQGEPAFSKTALWLFEVAPKGFETLTLYFNAIDPEKSEHFKEKVLPAIKEHYDHLEEYKAFEKALPKAFLEKRQTLNWF